MSVYIGEENALELLAELEGKNWEKCQIIGDINDTFALMKDSWERLIADGEEGEGLSVGDYAQFYHNWNHELIYGDGGYRRYAVRRDGEIMFLTYFNNNPVKEEQAKQLGFRCT